MKPNPFYFDKIAWTLVIALFFLIGCSENEKSIIVKYESGFDPPFLVDYNELKYVSNQYNKFSEPFFSIGNTIIDKANSWLDSSYYSVIYKKHLPASGDKHDYYSIGVYWWPDTTKADGLPYIRRDGFRNPERAEYDAPSLIHMINAVEELTLAYVFTKNEKYKDKAIGFLKTWFLDENTKMNPHLEHGQAIPGINDGRGIGIIETYKLVRVVDAIGILNQECVISNEVYEELVEWFDNYKNWLTTSKKGIDERNWHNNHGSSYDFQTLSFALFTDDTLTATSILDSVITKRIVKHIEPDGTQPFELDRTRAFHYPIYNLKFLCSIALLGEQLERDIWNFESEDKRSLAVAIEFLLPYLFEGVEWPYQRMDDMKKLKDAFYSVLNLADGKIKSLKLDKYFDFYSLENSKIHREFILRPNENIFNNNK